MPIPLALRLDGIDLHGQTRTLIMGIVAGIALTALYQNVTGLNAGGPLPAEAAIAPKHKPAQASTVQQEPLVPSPIWAQYPQIINTSPSLPVIPAPHASHAVATGNQHADRQAAALLVEDITAAAQETKVDDARGGGVHVVIRKKQLLQTLDQASESKSAEKPAQATSEEPSNQALPLAGPVKWEAAPVEAAQARHKATPDLRIVQAQPDGLLIRVGNQVHFIEAGAKR